MKIDVYIFACIENPPRMQVFLDRSAWVEKIAEELVGGEGELRWIEENDGMPQMARGRSGKQYLFYHTQFEIPIQVIVGLEGGVFQGACASVDGINVEPFDWDDECEELGKSKALTKFDQLTDGMCPVA